MKCSVCGTLNNVGAVFCRQCGSKLGVSECPKCKAVAEPGAQFCSKCGTRFVRSNETPGKTARAVALSTRRAQRTVNGVIRRSLISFLAAALPMVSWPPPLSRFSSECFSSLIFSAWIEIMGTLVTGSG